MCIRDRFRVEVETRIDKVENGSQVRVMAIQQEPQEKLDEIQSNMSGRMTKISDEVDQVKNQVNGNKEKIESMQHIQLNIQEEMDRLNIRPTCSTHHTTLENRDSVNFKDYRKYPIEFLEGVNEGLSRMKGNRWSIITTLLDDGFKGITDNCWSAVRNVINTYEEFKQAFQSKYWSESIQNIVRDNLSNRKYNPNLGQSPTAYFLGKVLSLIHI